MRHVREPAVPRASSAISRIQEHLPRQRSYLFDVPSDMVDVLSDLEVIRVLAVPRIRAETTAGISSKGRTNGPGHPQPGDGAALPRDRLVSPIQATDPHAAQALRAGVPEVPRDQPENRRREHLRRRPGVQQPEVDPRAHRWYEACLGLRPWRVSGTPGLATNRAIPRRRTHFNDSHLISLVGR
jgi:hypothetical protein